MLTSIQWKFRMRLRCMLLVIDMRQEAESFYLIRKSFFSRPERAFGALTTTIFNVLSSFPGSPLPYENHPSFPDYAGSRRVVLVFMAQFLLAGPMA